MSVLFEDVQKQVEHIVADLSGDEDFMPMMIIKDHRDRVLGIGLMLPQESEGKDVVAGSMAAICALHRAKEAAFTSVAWAVHPKPGEGIPKGSLAQHEGRQEIVMLNAVNSDGNRAAFTAALIRENNMVGVGLWTDMTGDGMTARGRFMEAMETGIRMGQNTPLGLANYLDEEIDKEGGEERLVTMMTEMYVKHLAELRAARDARSN